MSEYKEGDDYTQAEVEVLAAVLVSRSTTDAEVIADQERRAPIWGRKPIAESVMREAIASLLARGHIYRPWPGWLAATSQGPTETNGGE